MTLVSLARVALLSGAAFCGVLSSAMADENAPKLGPNATSLPEETDYLRQSSAPDYWAYSPFVKPQFSSSACSIAAVTAAVNGLRGLPKLAEDTVLTQTTLLETLEDSTWAGLSAEGGDGVTFSQLVEYTDKTLAALDMADYQVETFKPTTADEATLEKLRAILAANESTAEDVLLIYFNQGVVTGDWDGPHVSLIGAYNAAKDRVLILEVDQEWYIPYWTSVPVLLEAMTKPTSAEHGVLENETGGFVHVKRAG
ncbi:MULTISPECIES: phytochelatin synthase family protein [Sulfitobacter]|nr:phytochelatin synthase family protein [Sulfitobacter dubius]WOI29744.1 phytochelatin synthase family protein [Sulfitobacter dubius]|tara:strand:- start:145 stop:909 length:765 start_codon:yes stop_codon:yes gene_type:complete